jgi:hypothetical protein
MDKHPVDYFVWISGPINSGKSTLARSLCGRLGRAVNIELDTLAAFESTLQIDQKLALIIQDGLDLARNWASRQFVPVLNWPIYGNELRFLLNCSAKINLEPIIFNLVPSIDIVKTNRGQRALEQWELERIEYLYSACGMGSPTFGYSIDNSFLSIAETTELVLGQLGRRQLGLRVKASSV